MEKVRKIGSVALRTVTLSALALAAGIAAKYALIGLGF